MRQQVLRGEFVDQLRLAEPDSARWPRLIQVADRDDDQVEGFPMLGFTWLERMTDALRYVMSDYEGMQHRLYLPTLQH